MSANVLILKPYLKQVPAVDLSDDLSLRLRELFDAVGIAELESILRDRIGQYVEQGYRYGFKSLSDAIEQKLIDHLKTQGHTKATIDHAVDTRVPSREWIRKFYTGSNICINYMNTLAFFFNVRFFAVNYDLVQHG